MKKSVFSLLLAAASGPALPAESPVDRLVGCAEIADSRERLACFDREVAPLPSARRPPRAETPSTVVAPPTIPAPAPLSAPAPVAAPAASAPAPAPATAAQPAPAVRSFGEEQLQPKDRPATTEESQALHARIQRLRAVTANDFIIYLDNGQAWRHQDVTLGGYLREGEAITITKGTLGSYRLTRDAGASKNWIRVNRIK